MSATENAFYCACVECSDNWKLRCTLLILHKDVEILVALLGSRAGVDAPR